MIYRKLISFCIVRGNSYRYYCISREARFLQKLIDKGKSGSRQHVPKATSKSSNASNTLVSIASRRCDVLNQVFMDRVNDLINTELYSEGFNEYGISITQCKINRSLRVLFVYWIHTKEINETNEDKVNELLANFGNHLAKTLSSFTIISRPPAVRLAKDVHFLKEEIITNLLKDLKLADEKEKEIDGEKLQLQMGNNVLGLDYCKILERIIKAKEGSKRSTTPPIQINSFQEILTTESKFDMKKLRHKIFGKRQKTRRSKEIGDILGDYFRDGVN